MFAYGKGDITRVQGGFVEPDADISDVFDAALPYFLYNERSNSKSSVMNDIYEPLLEIIAVSYTHLTLPTKRIV